jgi:hypothetical protein
MATHFPNLTQYVKRPLATAQNTLAKRTRAYANTKPSQHQRPCSPTSCHHLGRLQAELMGYDVGPLSKLANGRKANDSPTTKPTSSQNRRFPSPCQAPFWPPCTLHRLQKLDARERDAEFALPQNQGPHSEIQRYRHVHQRIVAPNVGLTAYRSQQT